MPVAFRFTLRDGFKIPPPACWRSRHLTQKLVNRMNWCGSFGPPLVHHRHAYGKNPFTGQEQWFEAKPATVRVKVRALKKIKDAALNG